MPFARALQAGDGMKSRATKMPIILKSSKQPAILVSPGKFKNNPSS
jgi:hypothetical protein